MLEKPGLGKGTASVRPARQSSVPCLGCCGSAARHGAGSGGCWHPIRAPRPLRAAQHCRFPWAEQRQERRVPAVPGTGPGWRRGRSADTGVRLPGDGAAGPARAVLGGTGTARPRPVPRGLRVGTGGSGPRVAQGGVPPAAPPHPHPSVPERPRSVSLHPLLTKPCD